MTKILDIKLYPNHTLRQRAEEIEHISDEIKELAKNMLETMYLNNGIGLAANQVGILKRIIVIDITDEKDGIKNNNPMILINPVLLYKSDETIEYEEGCLSIPEVSGLVTRPKIIEVEYLDINGERCLYKAENLLSTCIQHEIDHLNGILFFDHLTRLKKDVLLRKYNRLLSLNKKS